MLDEYLPRAEINLDTPPSMFAQGTDLTFDLERGNSANGTPVSGEVTFIHSKSTNDIGHLRKLIPCTDQSSALQCRFTSTLESRNRLCHK